MLHLMSNHNAVPQHPTRTPIPSPQPASLANTLAYLIVCNAGWFVCVISAANGRPWIGVLFTAAAVAFHLASAQQARLEFNLLATVLGLAALWESLLTATGLLVYPNGMVFPHAAPYWILALWALFAMQLNVLFRWLRGRYWLAALVGALAGPLSFRAGAALGAVQFPDPLLALAALGAGWALWLPAMIALATHWDGTQPRRQ
jgi:hypothetical protein